MAKSRVVGTEVSKMETKFNEVAGKIEIEFGFVHPNLGIGMTKGIILVTKSR